MRAPVIARPLLAGVLVVLAAAVAALLALGPAAASNAQDGPTRLIVSQVDAAVALAGDAAQPDAAGVSAIAAEVTEADAAVVSAFDIDGQSFVVVEDDAGAGAALASAFSAAGFAVDPDVRYTAARTPNDPLWHAGWGQRMGSTDLWSTATGAGTVVAVIDSGVNVTPDLPEHRLLPGAAFTDDGDPDWQDISPTLHGTKSAESAAATANNEVGNAGGCWDCHVLPVRVSDRLGAFASDVARGVTWAVDEGADVITISLGGRQEDPATRAATRYAVEQDRAVFAAAGNDADAEPRYPAAYPGVVGVAGLRNRNVDDPQLHPDSNWGSAVIAAPFCVDLDAGLYCGTSASTPLVAGHAASLISAGFTADQVTAALVDTAGPVADERFEGGHLDASAALTALGDGVYGPPGPPRLAPPLCPGAPSVRVVQGADRFETAAVLADLRGNAYGQPSSVVVAAGRPFIDAIAAGPALGRDAVVLLTERDALSRESAARLDRIEPDLIVVAGGPVVVSAEVERQLADYAEEVVRVAGADREATAAALAALGPTDTLRIADGRDMPQALTAAGWSGALHEGLLLSGPDTLGRAAADSLRRHRPETAVAARRPDASDVGMVEDLARLAEQGVIGGYRLADPTAPGKFPEADRLMLTTNDGVVDAVSAAALSAASGYPVFVPSEDWGAGGREEAAAVIDALAPEELWLLGRAGSIDPYPLVCE